MKKIMLCSPTGCKATALHCLSPDNQVSWGPQHRVFAPSREVVRRERGLAASLADVVLASSEVDASNVGPLPRVCGGGS